MILGEISTTVVHLFHLVLANTYIPFQFYQVSQQLKQVLLTYRCTKTKQYHLFISNNASNGKLSPYFLGKLQAQQISGGTLPIDKTPSCL